MHLVIPTHVYFFWMRCHSSRTFLLKELEWDPKIGCPFSLPLDHTILYLWPMAHLPCIGWVQIGGDWALCACSTFVWIHHFFGLHAFAIASTFDWFRCTFWYSFNSCGVNDTWAFGLSFSTFHLIFGLSIVWVWALSLLPGPCPLLSCVCGLAGALAMPLRFSCCNITYHFTLLLPLGLRVEALASPFLTFLSSFGPYWPAILLGQPIPCLRLHRPISFLGILCPFHSSLPLSLPWVFAKSFGLPGPITTSLPFGLIGFCADPMNLLIPFLDFLGPVYFLSISYNSHGFTTSFLGFPRPICFLPSHLLILWVCWPLFLPFWSYGLYFTIFFSISFILLEFFCHWALLSKVGINNY